MTAIVNGMERIKRVLHCRTWHIEAGFVTSILVTSAAVQALPAGQWLGVAAVIVTFMSVQVSDRLEYSAQTLQEGGQEIVVHCYKWITRYLIAKEALWVAYFIYMGAWPALVGSGIFLLYKPWRRWLRKHHPPA